MICHTVHGEGRLFGPVLNGAGAMDPESLLRSVVTPSAAVEAGYYRYRVETSDGESIDGLFLSQNENEILLRPITGEDIRIPRSKVKKAGFSKTSPFSYSKISSVGPFSPCPGKRKCLPRARAFFRAVRASNLGL